MATTIGLDSSQPEWPDAYFCQQLELRDGAGVQRLSGGLKVWWIFRMKSILKFPWGNTMPS